jgi:hypothetical protein
MVHYNLETVLRPAGLEFPDPMETPMPIFSAWCTVWANISSHCGDRATTGPRGTSTFTSRGES